MITINLDKIDKISKLLISSPGEVDTLVAQALNSAANSARTRASSRVRKEYLIDKDVAKKELKLLRATAGSLHASLHASGTPIALSKYQTIPDIVGSGSMVYARVKIASSLRPIRKGFVASMSNGFLNIFEREGRSQYPIKGLYGPSLPQMYSNEKVIKDVEKAAEKQLERRLDRELAKLLGGV